jgi:glutamyl-Q tRNA(Asp) synthetase
MTTTRFAPSPTGLLHLGHAYSALHAASFVDAARGDRFLVRIEDIDRTRCRPEFEAAILEDLVWLGLAWERPVRRQSDHMDDYRTALERLETMGLLYKCFHSRKELDEALSAPHNRPMMGPDGPAVTGTDALMPEDERIRREAAGEPYALRLRMAEALRRAGPLSWVDRIHGTQTARPELFGDVVLARKDVATSYHLAVTVDDALQGVTLVTRGEDLFQASHVHRLLQALLDLPVPEYAHHPLLSDPETGRRFAKRDRSLTLKTLRESGMTAAQIRARVGF